MAHSPTHVTHYLKGLEMPTDKDGLLEHARENDAPEDVLDEIEAMPDMPFNTMAEIMKAFGQSNS